MIEDQGIYSKSFVIVIAGNVGSGKSTIAASLSRVLGNAPVLFFDHYEKFVEWPQDMGQWIREGADPDQIRVPKLKEDLLDLLHGITVSDPLDGKILNPSKYILLEEPSGGLRAEIRPYIDWVAYIDLPEDLCVVRLIARLINMDVWRSQGTLAGEAKEDLACQLDMVANWITHYQQARSMYTLVSHRVRQQADLVIDGTLTVEEITAEVVKGIRDREPRSQT